MASLAFGGGCQKEGLAQRFDSGSGISGDASGGSPGAGGSIDAGGLGGGPGDGGSTALGGTLGLGGTAAVGGGIGAGGVLAAGGIVGKGGSSGLGGIVGSGGTIPVATGGKPGTGGVVTTGGRTGVGGSSGTGGSTSITCGGIIGAHCPTGQFCDYLASTCGKSDASGTCTTPSTICPSIYAPVCGCDGETYDNDCTRQSNRVSKASQGACTACPADIAQIGNWPCTEGLTCQYGSDPRPECHPSATCTGGAWTVSPSTCEALPPETCPATREAAADQACTTKGAYCSYGDLACECTNCSSGPISLCTGFPTWHCAAPNADATCPAGMPLLGTACSTEGKACTYACGTGNGRTCKQGAWYAADGGQCPVSSRRAKKDIVYLSEIERQHIASDVARLRLATYEYRDRALAGKRHLGFIIEDVPGSPAVDRDGNMVDLYGYASMLVAAFQEQSREIADLKAEIAQLKRASAKK
jgi:hypothetical protein